MKVAIYIRVSTEEQAMHGYSVAAQEERLLAYCHSQDWEVIKIYKDEGKSAKDLERPSLKKMMNDIKLGLIDIVLVYRLDRLTRSVLDLYKLLAEFDKYDVMFKSATEIYDTTTATGRLFITLVAALAQWERENLAERVKMGMLKKANLGEWLGGSVPYGYVRDGEGFKIIEAEAKIVKRIFKMARTTGMDQIAKKLNLEGFRTRRSAKFAGYTVQYIAKNPFYIGKMRHNDEEGNTRKPLEEQRLFDTELIEPLIDEKEFWELQKILEKRSEHKGKRMTGGYYFTSILKCGKCGGPMTGTTHRFKTGTVKYYRCQRKLKGNLCIMPTIKEEYLTAAFLKEFNSFVFGWLKADKYETANRRDDNEEILIELNDIQRKMNKHKIMFVNDLIEIEELNEIMNKLKSREKELNEKLNTVKKQNGKSWTSEELENLVEDFPKFWEISTNEERKILLSSILEEVVVDADEKSKCGPGNPKPFWIVSMK